MLLLLTAIAIAAAGCAEQVENNNAVREPEAEEILKVFIEEELPEIVSISKDGPLAPKIYGPSSGAELSLVCPENNYLLGSLNGQLNLYRFPEQEYIKTFAFNEEHTPLYFTWHPGGASVLIFTESGGNISAWLVSLDGEIEEIITFDNAAYDTDYISLDNLDLRVGFLEWSHHGAAFALDIHREESSSIKLVNLQGQILTSENFDDRSHLRSPLTSPEGDRIAFTNFGISGENLWLWDLDEEQLSQITEGTAGDYPYYWTADNQLVVIIGGIGTGGGHHHGLAEIDLETGEQNWLYTFECQQKIFVPAGTPPGVKQVLGVERSLAGTEARAMLLDPESGELEQILDHYSIYQAEWLTENEFVFYAEGWKDEEDLYEKREDHFVIKHYSPEDGLTVLVESEQPLHLLGVANDTVHYLDSEETSNLWVWRTVNILR